MKLLHLGGENQLQAKIFINLLCTNEKPDSWYSEVTKSTTLSYWPFTSRLIPWAI